jgi:zinc protease
VATEGPSEENLAKVKEFMLKKHAESVKENSYWLGQLDSYYEENVDLNTEYEQTLNAITAADVQQFIKALLDQQNRIEVSMTSPGEPAAEATESSEENK